MRPPTACRACRVRRRRCIIPKPGDPCTLCAAQDVECSSANQSLVATTHFRPPSSVPRPPLRDTNLSHDGLSSVGSSPVESEPQARDVKSLLPDKAICNDLVDLYFDMMHDKEGSLFHRPSFVADQRQGRAPMVLVWAIIALAARFSSDPFFDGTNRWERGRVWGDQSRRLFNNRSVQISITAVQACSLLGTLAFAESDIAMECMYSATANRMVQLLDLPNRLSPDRVQREVEIRVWWTIWMTDTWLSAGTKLPKQITIDPAYPKPMEELAFEALQPGNAAEESEPIGEAIRLRDSGLWTQMIPLTQAFSEINKLNDRTVQHPESRLQLYENVEAISNKLDSWLLRLPPQLHNTPENLQRFTKHGHARTFIALHLGYHHHGQLLYYQFLHSNNSPLPNPALAHTYANRCKDHAAAISNLLWTANTTPGSECLWMLTGHLLVISSSIHLHTLLFETADSLIADAKQMLERNFELLIQLRSYWPSLDITMSRLRAFHRACQASMHTSFAMDQWMLHFLQRYAAPVLPDRIHGPEPPAAKDFGKTEGAIPYWPSPEQSGNAQQLWYSSEEEANGLQLLQTFI